MIRKTTKGRKKILIVDDQPVMRQGLIQVIDSESDLVACGEAGSGAQALNFVAARRPDLVLTEIFLPDRSGIELIKDLRVFQPDLPVLVFSIQEESVYVERVLRVGGRGYIMKRETGRRLIQAIRQILAGNISVSEKMSTKILQMFTGGRPAAESPVRSLSPREFEVFEHIGKGLGTREVAQRLRISVKTVEVHRANIKRKLQLKSPTEMVRSAVRWFEFGQSGHV
jgi:DNA-binding NarL/FixJ family response regulator